MIPLKIWIQATRPQFFTVIILPITLGTVIAWREHQQFSLAYFLLMILGGTLLHAAINVLNDYFDHLNHCDELNSTPLTPFAGGSRMIQQGQLSPQQVRRYGLFLLSTGIVTGLILVWLCGLPVLWIGLLGVLSGYFYSAPPFALCSRGWGEILVGLNFGVLAVLGAYFVQAHYLSVTPIIAALPIAGLVTAILYINQFPDYIADKQVGKVNLVVRLGQVHARKLYSLLLIFSFISLFMGVLWAELPTLALISGLLIPVAIFAHRQLLKYYDQPYALIPAIQATIFLHTAMSICLIVSFIYR